MGIMTINVNPRELQAVGDEYNFNDLIKEQILDVMNNDSLGIEPTTISSINTDDFTLGTLSVTSDNKILFEPNSVIGSDTFNYTIVDSTLATSTTTVIINIL